MSKQEKYLLCIDDEPGHRMMIRAVMEDTGWTVHEADSGEEGLAKLDTLGLEAVNVVLVDMCMPGMDGHAVLAAVQKKYAGLPVILLTAYGTVGTAVEAMKKGAFDYLTKPADNDALVAVLEKAWEQGAVLRQDEPLRQRQASPDATQELIGKTPPMQQLKDFIAQAGPSEATILIQGESGTGKELIARALHKASSRASAPMIKVNCAALPENLLESELFGYEKGAFTGAIKNKPGRFQLAHSGTLFLDEIGEIPLELQAKLLRAIQERVIEPLGSVKPQQVDVRIIAATNRDLRLAVAEGLFREDLFFRLNVLELVSPPLRERVGDIPDLVDTILQRLSAKNSKRIPAVSPELLRALQQYAWPGNVRELENVLERILILSRSDTLGIETLPVYMFDKQASQTQGLAQHPTASSIPPQFGAGAHSIASATPLSPIEEAERGTLITTLEKHGGHRERTAEALGISRRALQYKLKKYGLNQRG